MRVVTFLEVHTNVTWGTSNKDVFRAPFVHWNYFNWQVFVGCRIKPQKKSHCTLDVVIHHFQLFVLYLPEWNDTISSLVLLEKEKCFWLYLPGLVSCCCAVTVYLFVFKKLTSLMHLPVVCPWMQITQAVGVGKLENFLSAWFLLNAEDWWHTSRVKRRGRPKHVLSLLPLLQSEQQRDRGRKTCSLKDPIPTLP